jgi:hypothetical protein
MLGRQPLDAVDDMRVMSIYLDSWVMEPDDQHEFTDVMTELTPTERTVCMDRLNARDPQGKMVPKSPEAARAELLALIASEEERLEGVLAGHLEREEAELAVALAFDDSVWGQRLRKYEETNDRLLLRIIETLRKRREKADGTTTSGGRASVRAGSPSGDLGSGDVRGRETRDEQRPDDIAVGVAASAGRDAPVPPESPFQNAGSGRAGGVSHLSELGRQGAHVPRSLFGADSEGETPTTAIGDLAPAVNGLMDEEIHARALLAARIAGVVPAPATPAEPATTETRSSAASAARSSAPLLGALLALFVLIVSAGFHAAFAASEHVFPPLQMLERPGSDRTSVPKARNTSPSFEVMRATERRAKGGPPIAPA